MRLLITLSLLLTQAASAHDGEHAMTAGLYLTHVLSEHGLSLGLGVLIAAAVLWALVLRGERQG